MTQHKFNYVTFFLLLRIFLHEFWLFFFNRRRDGQVMSKNGDKPFFSSLPLPDDVIVTGSFNTK